MHRLSRLIFLFSLFFSFFQTNFIFGQFEIKYTVSSAHQFTFSHYLENLNRICGKIMRHSKDTQIPIQFVVINDFPEGIKIVHQNSTLIIAELSANELRLQYDPELNRKLILTVLMARSGIYPNELKTPFPDWIILGIFGKINPRHKNHLLPATRFPGLTALTAAGELPNPEKTLTTPIIEARDGTAAIRLYEEYCVFALDCLEQLPLKGEKVFIEIAQICRSFKISELELLNKTVFSEIIKQHKINDAHNSAEYVKEFFKSHAEKRFLTSLNPLPITELEKRFNEKIVFQFETNSYSKPEIRNAILEQLPILFKSMKNGEPTVVNLNNRLVKLANQSNAEIKVKIAELIKINHEIIIGGQASPRTHSAKINIITSEIRNLFSFYKKIEIKLTEIETKMLTPADLFRHEIEEINGFSPLFPEVEKILDKYEKEIKHFYN